jgi:integrase
LFYGYRELRAVNVKNKTWNKTRVQGLLRHRGGTYYARLYVAGKEKWLSLDTSLLEVAKSKLDEEKKALAEAKETGWEPQAGLVKVEAAVSAYREALKLRVGIKDSTRQFYEWSLDSILRSWPELPELDVRHVTEGQCKQWGKTFSDEYSATYYNNAVLVLCAVFDQAIKSGVIYRNPARVVELKKKTQKALVLPSREEFHSIVAHVRAGKHRTAIAAADLIEFLAYTGCRVSEARRVTWADCNLEKQTITVKGDPITGTKNWKIRTIPMISAAKQLLEQLQTRRPDLKPDSKVCLVGDVRGAFARASEGLTLPQYSHHDLRHLFATTCIESGVDIPTISRWLGHSDGGTLAMKTYGHLRDEHSRESAQRVSF